MNRIPRLAWAGAAVLASIVISSPFGCSTSGSDGAYPPGVGGGASPAVAAETGSGVGPGAGGSCGGGVDPATLGAPCCSKNGGSARCVPASAVPASAQSDFGSCSFGESGSGLCVPDEIIAQGPHFQPQACVFPIGNAPGVCLSLCIDRIAKDPNVGLLKQQTCPAGDVCVPCTNPLTKMPTGACDIKGAPCGGASASSGVGTSGAGGAGPMCPYDGPPLVDPKMFPDCAPACGGAHCVPAAAVPQAEQAQLSPCNSGMGLCVPDEQIASEGKAVPKSCTSIAGAEGRCLSTCLPAIAAQAALLPSDACAGGEKCAPCFNPAAKDPKAATGACGIACDTPKQPPVVLTCPWNGPAVIDPASLPDCSPACGGAHCLPAELVPPAQQAQLSPCSAASGPGFCAPDPIIAAGGNDVPSSCDPFVGSGAEGRCLSQCLPQVAAQQNLVQSSCQAGESCVPCTDPFSGMPTGACTTACDQPQSPPFTFPTCCQDATCIPAANVPADQQKHLKQDDCPDGPNYLCVPNEYVPQKNEPPQTCQALLGNGACISQCVDIPFSFLFSQGSCPDNHLCVGCAFAGKVPGC